MNRIIQNNFTGGLLSEVMWGRNDLNKYANGLEECINFIPQVYGGLKTRPGKKYIGDLDDLVDGQNCRLIPFVFSVTQSYILVFTHLKMRIIRDGGFVVYPAGDPDEGDVVEIVSPYTSDQLFGINEAQILDTMYVVHPEVARQKLTRADHHDWAFAAVTSPTVANPVVSGTTVSGNLVPEPGSSREYFYKVTAVDGASNESEPAETGAVEVTNPWPAGGTITLSWTAVVGAVSYRIYKYVNGVFGLVVTTGGLEYIDNNDTPSATTPGTPDPSVDTPSLAAPVINDILEVSPGDGRTIFYKVSALDAAGSESIPVAEHTAFVNRAWTAGGTVTIEWAAVTGAAFYRIYKNTSGFYGLAGEVSNLLFVDDNIRPTINEAPQVAGPAFGANERPSAVGVYEQRIMYGGSNNFPITLFGSQTARLDNFQKGNLFDEDSLEFTLFSTLNERILHFVSLEKLFVFTTESEKIVDGGANSDALTPTTIKHITRTRLGSSHVPPRVVGGDIMFVERGGRRVHNMFYSLEADGFDTMELTLLVPGLFGTSQIRDWTWDADNLFLWVITTDGCFYSLTYDRKQQVWAWAKHVTDGDVLSVSGIKTESGVDIFVATQRTRVVAGAEQDTFQIEQIFEGDRTNPKTAFCVDSGLTYSGAPATTISGLDHLIGREVAILADGGVVNTQTVNPDGQITLEAPASEVVVGLPFSCIARPTRLNVNAGTTTIQNMPKCISHVVLRVIKTRGLTVSTPNDGRRTPIEIKPRRNELYAEPSDLQSGDVRLAVFGSWNRDGYIEVRQDTPLPAHITAIIAEVELED